MCNNPVGNSKDLPKIFQGFAEIFQGSFRNTSKRLRPHWEFSLHHCKERPASHSRDLPKIFLGFPEIFQGFAEIFQGSFRTTNFRKIKTLLWIFLAPLQGKAGIPFGHLGQFQGSSMVLPGIFQGSSRDLPGIFQVSSRDPLRIQGSSRDLPRSSRNTSERFRPHFEFAWHHCKERPASHSVI